MGSIVDVAEESAIIVWDEPHGIEHFIRRATFRSDTPNFGFLVPTPTVPELKEERDDIFVRLEDLMRPEILKEEIHGVRPVSFFLSFFMLNRVSEEAVPAVHRKEMEDHGLQNIRRWKTTGGNICCKDVFQDRFPFFPLP
jgi:hypothetical protein